MPEIQHEQMIQLLSELINRTENADLPWQVVSQSCFGLETDDASVSISSRDLDDSPPFVLSLYNSQGILVDELTTLWYTPDDAASWNQALELLFFRARAQAYNVSQLVRDFLHSVDDDKTLPWSRSEKEPSTYSFDEEPF